MKNVKDINLEDVKLNAVYAHELWWLANGIREKTARLFDETRPPNEGYKLQISPEVHSLIASVLSDAANIKKLLVTPSARLQGETGRQSRLRKARTVHLNNLISGINPVELLNAKVRNTLEHFDEYLDEANIELADTKEHLATFAFYNIVVSHRESFNFKIYPLRLYVSSERKFYNMKWSVSLDAINKEAAAIADRLIDHMGISNGQPGGLMIPL